MNLTNLVIFSLIILILLFFIKIKVNSRNTATKKEHSYRKLNALFTPAERSFYGVLSQAVNNDALIFGKVRVADVLTPEKSTVKGVWQTAFNKISAKHFDFVLCKKDDLSFICAIELDDRSHNSAKRKVRDAFLEEACQSADFPLVRFPAKAAYKISEVQEALSTHLTASDVNEAVPLTAVIEPCGLGKASSTEADKKNCPKCSSEMTIRVAKKDSSVGNEFWGCSAFPKCRYMEPLSA